jgi:hypothetical protein
MMMGGIEVLTDNSGAYNFQVRVLSYFKIKNWQKILRYKELIILL